jgi:hypothetical protein
MKLKPSVPRESARHCHSGELGAALRRRGFQRRWNWRGADGFRAIGGRVRKAIRAAQPSSALTASWLAPHLRSRTGLENRPQKSRLDCCVSSRRMTPSNIHCFGRFFSAHGEHQSTLIPSARWRRCDKSQRCLKEFLTCRQDALQRDVASTLAVLGPAPFAPAMRTSTADRGHQRMLH